MPKQSTGGSVQIFEEAGMQRNYDYHPAFDQYRRVNDVTIGPIRRILCVIGGLLTTWLALAMFSLVPQPNLIPVGRVLALFATGALLVPAIIFFIRAWRGK